MKYPDVAEASFAKETRSLPSCSHGLHGIHPRLHPLHTPQSHGSHSYARTPNHSTVYRFRIHRCKSKFPATQWLLLKAQWFFAEHWQAFGLLHPHTVESSRKWVASLFPVCPDHVHPSACFCGPFDPFGIRHQGCLYVLPQHRLHQTQPRHGGLFSVFFNNSFTKLASHLMNVATVKPQLFCNLLIGQIQSHEVEAQDPNFKGLMMPGKDGTGKVVETLSAFFTLITLPGRFFFIETSSDNSPGVTKWTLSSFWPAQLSYSVITLCIIDQILYIYLHLVDSFHGLENVKSSFTTSRPRNPT